MKIETLKERIEKAETKISKKQATIEKKQKSIQKKVETLQKKYGIQYNETKMLCTSDLEQLGLSQEDAWTASGMQCDIESLMDDLERLPKEIAEIQKTLEKYKAQLAGEIERESMFINDIPEAMKELESRLIEEWNRWDIERRNRLKKSYKELGHREFRKIYSYADYNFMSETDEDIDKSNKRFARQEVLDLYIRVKDVTGEVTDWSGITLTDGNTFPVLNGVVTGKEGKASVESIVAGGYNIQRLHIRTLVHNL